MPSACVTVLVRRYYCTPASHAEGMSLRLDECYFGLQEVNAPYFRFDRLKIRFGHKTNAAPDIFSDAASKAFYNLL